MEISDRYLYFIYSDEYREIRNGIESKMCRSFEPGRVLVNGVWKLYTHKSTSSELQYSDSVIVTEGYESNILFEDENVKPIEKDGGII